MSKPIFSNAQLAQIVAETLPELPAGHTNAVVAAVDRAGVKVVAGFSLRDGWQFEGAYKQNWDGERAGGVRILKSW